MKNSILILILICLSIGGAGICFAAPPNVPEILDAYKATQDKIKAVIIKYESIIESDTFLRSRPEISGKRVKHTWGELRTDGSRITLREHEWGNVGLKLDSVPQEFALYGNHTWDGKQYAFYQSKSNKTGIPGHLLIERDKNESRNKAILIGSEGSFLLGYFGSQRTKRVDEVLRSSSQTLIREKMEPIAGIGCYVIDSTTPFGKYSVWFDPTHGFNVARAEITVAYGDSINGRPIKEHETKYNHIVENIRFEMIGTIWVPMEGIYRSSFTYIAGNYAKSTEHYKQTQLILNPDLDGIGAFDLDDVQDGSICRYSDMSQLLFEWSKGKPVPKIDAGELKELAANLNKFKHDDVLSTRPELYHQNAVINVSEKTTVRSDITTHATPDKNYYSFLDNTSLLIAFFCFVFAGGMLYFYMRKNS